MIVDIEGAEESAGAERVATAEGAEGPGASGDAGVVGAPGAADPGAGESGVAASGDGVPGDGVLGSGVLGDGVSGDVPGPRSGDAPSDESSGDVPSGVTPEEAAAFAAVTGGDTAAGPARVTGFQVSLPEFEGPFDLLLGLISKHKLDVTTLALSKVTDEFIAYIRSKGQDWDLDQASEFLLIAATLLDLKAARLLPTAEVEDEEDLALLEARDLLFARLLQYRAYKQVAAELAGRHAEASRMFPRAVKLEPSFADLLPEVVINLTPEQFAALAVKAMTPKEPPKVSVTHLHGSNVSVREQVAVLVSKLRKLRRASFKVLCADAPDTLTIVARFLGLLELFREAAVTFDQEDAFGDLQVAWTGSEEGEVRGGDQFDEGDDSDPDADPDADLDAGPDGGPIGELSDPDEDETEDSDDTDGVDDEGGDLDQAGEAE